MGINVNVTIGGEAGQGIQTVGDLLAVACHTAGLYLMGINDFESRIRGGHSFMQLRISDQPVCGPRQGIHLLVALNRDTYDRHHREMTGDGLILSEHAEKSAEKQTAVIPFTQIATDAGGNILANTVAAGACLALLGAPFDAVEQVLRSKFGKKEEILEQNIRAAGKGFDAARDISVGWRFDWPSDPPKGRLLTGSQALARGALAADCRLASFYPMSPATGIMISLVEFSDRLPIVVEQAEDEIGAVNMIIGASFAGVRAMTATSGGGFSLMAEGLGLAGITETPIVIINAQRPGPATGLPTRTAQGDLLFVIRASQDEFPRFVFAPRSVDNGFDTVVRAFHLAEKYQVPVIVLVDQYFCDSMWIAEGELKVPSQIDRFTAGDGDLRDPSAYKRFELTESGVSPRALPCNGRALVKVTANEHSEDGHISEAASDRSRMVEKRNSKLPSMTEEMAAPAEYHGESDLLLVGWGSSDGIVREAVDILRSEDYNVGSLSFCDLWPFPVEKAKAALKRCSRFFTVEQNASSQLGWLIRQQTGHLFDRGILKTDGRPLMPEQVAEQVKFNLEDM